ncbi:MAG TPA: thioredoxin domain-containing protein [Syntrophomonas sp.]|nr:thioredoxin domain-containing protein [Syntrophomonas sp.]
MVYLSTTSIPNHLIREKSPYLLQHANNPVDWYPWGEEAFVKAKAEDKPIFLSIGYSTCHWCHVMAHECFEDGEVAELLNRSFVAIKVDREERPDIDQVYMTACQGLTGHGGWPLTIIMDADQRPFYAATYLPKNSRGFMPGLTEILTGTAQAWADSKEELLQAGRKISQWLQDLNKQPDDSQPQTFERSLLDAAYHQFERNFDREWGGFGSAPKFPSPHNMLFLLGYYQATQTEKALQMVTKTLQCMYRGGIYDHIGFGFARYSTDRYWLAPHFEKMLYDNALLAMAFLECYQITEDGFYGEAAREIFSYVRRDMTGPEGGFYSAEDADSEGEEGKFYLWSREEIEAVLGEQAEPWAAAYDITSAGNFEGKNIPNLIHTREFFKIRKSMETERQKLLAFRSQRPRPLRDDKILTGWNGLMIAAMARGARILQEDIYLQEACRAADFIDRNLRRDDGRLLARYRDGQAEYPAYAADYACFIWGLLELHEAVGGDRYLTLARQLNRDLLGYFWDEKAAGLFFYGHDAERLLSRPKETYDGAIPSANAVAALNFLRLAEIDGSLDLAAKSRRMLDNLTGQIAEQPTAYSFWLLAALYELFPHSSVL